MRLLLPTFIWQAQQAGQPAGRFPAVCLLADVSGFTPLTSTLMAYGPAGAEEVAKSLSHIFQPLVQTIYQQGGVLVGFAGDALKAVFPTDQPQAPERAITAAWQMYQLGQTLGKIVTPWGEFQLTLKLCVAQGEVTWGIISTPAGQAVSYVEGRGLQHCFVMDEQTRPGELLVTQELFQQAHPFITGEKRAEYQLVTAVEPAFVAQFPPRPEPIPLPPAAIAHQFFPPLLWHTPIQGEFRHVVTVFINTHTFSADFITLVYRLLTTYGGYLCRIGRIGAQEQNGATFLLFWGAPISYENNVERALNFLGDLRLQAEEKWRAGMSSGLAYAGFVGGEGREEYTCYSPAVNLAARLMVAAGWRQIWLDQETAGAAGGYFQLQPQEEKLFKGFTQPQPVYELLEKLSLTTALPKFTRPLVGREAELAQLTQWFMPLFYGRPGGGILITGEAGLGKSHLVDWFRQQLPVPVWWFSCGTDPVLHTPLTPFRVWLRRYFALGSTADSQLFEQKLTHLLQQLPPTPLAQEVGQRVQKLASFLAAVLELSWEGSPYAQAKPEERLPQIFEALRLFFQALCCVQPLVLHVDDAQWLDAESTRFLAYLWPYLEQLNGLVLLTTRPGWSHSWPMRHTLTLQPLKPAALHTLASFMLGQSPSPALQAVLEERTEGNPFFAEQILLYVQEQGNQAQNLEQLRQVLPQDVQTLLVARVDHLSQEVKQVVQTAAVLGREFEVQVLAQMLEPAGVSQVPGRVQEAEQAHIWYALSELTYLFQHTLLQEAAYEMQLFAQRQLLHHTAGLAMEQLYRPQTAPHSRRLAYHFEQAGVWDKTVVYLKEAISYAGETYQMESAIALCDHLYHLWQQVIPAGEKKREQAEILLRKGRLMWQISYLGDAEMVFQQAQTLAEQAQDQRLVHRAQQEMATIMVWHKQYDEAITHCQRLIAKLDPAEERPELCRVYNALGLALLNVGRGDEALHAFEQALHFSNELPSYKATIWGNMGLAHWKKGALTSALHWYEQALHLSQEQKDPAGVARHTNNLGLIYMEQGQYSQALHHLQEALTIDRQLGQKRAQGTRLGNMGICYSLTGQFATAITHLQEALAIDRQMGYKLGEGLWYGNLGECYALQEKYEQALPYFQQAITHLRDLGAKYNLPWVLVGQGRTLLALQKLDEAERLGWEAAALAEQVNRPEKLFLARLLLAQVSLARGERAAGVEQLHQLLQEPNQRPEQAAEVYFCLWQAEGDDEYRREALRLYELAYAQNRCYEFKQFVERLRRES